MLTCLDWRIIWLGIVTTLVFTVGGLGEIIDSPSLWVNYDLSKLDDALISELNRNLLDRGAFLLPGFLSEDFLATLQQEVHGAQTARYEKMRTILQDSGDFSGAFPDDSIRNILFNNSMNFIPRTFFPDDSMIHHFYEGDFFLEFLKLVVGSSEVYRSADYEGSVTGARGTRQDSYSFAWHFDEHPLVITLYCADYITYKYDTGISIEVIIFCFLEVHVHENVVQQKKRKVCAFAQLVLFVV
mmetsp:Transcript_28010/g.48582  ORF Transcript_28010/g.48582 Transcript_28010/m.48582 type:complete len:242 (+) Transcript_28010:189-914(+)